MARRSGVCSIADVAHSSRTEPRLAAVSWAGRESRRRACAAGRTLVEDRKRRVDEGNPRARVVVARRNGRQGVCDYGHHGWKIEATADRDRVQQRVRRRAAKTGTFDAANPGARDRAGHRTAERSETSLPPILPEPEERQSGMAEGILHRTAAGRAPSQEQLYFRDPRDRWEACLRVCCEYGAVGV